MKSTIAIALFAGFVAAQLDGIPKCAQQCVISYTTGDKVAGCRTLDVKCICSNEDFLSGIACCLEKACDQAGKDAAVDYAKSICSAQGVSVPDEVVCKAAESSGASSASSSASNTASTASQTSPTGTPTESSASETESPGAAAGLHAAGGALGAVVAMLMAL